MIDDTPDEELPVWLDNVLEWPVVVASYSAFAVELVFTGFRWAAEEWLKGWRRVD